MCDYSLMAVPNRLAREGEELVAHRFPTGSLGLASPMDLKRAADPPVPSRKNFWRAALEFFNPPKTEPVPAVCIPPGARLGLQDIPLRLQHDLGVGPAEPVTFTQISAAVNSYRDAVRFLNGREVRLQELREGQRVRVLDLSVAEELDLLPHQRWPLQVEDWRVALAQRWSASALGFSTSPGLESFSSKFRDLLSTGIRHHVRGQSDTICATVIARGAHKASACARTGTADRDAFTRRTYPATGLRTLPPARQAIGL